MDLLLETKSCRTCGKPFDDITGRVGRPRLYCSGMCRGQWYLKQRIGFTGYEVAEAHGSACYLCGELVDWEVDGDMRAEVDHIVPVYLGGTNTMTNLRLVHRVCNMRKGQSIQCPHCKHRFT